MTNNVDVKVCDRQFVTFNRRCDRYSIRGFYSVTGYVTMISGGWCEDEK